MSTPARADSWASPSTETYEAANGRYRVTIEPSPLTDLSLYYDEEIETAVDGRTLERPVPIGLLERKTETGSWEPLWGAPLANAIAPVDALVSNDGRYVVTFDNWHSVGHGENVIVIYGADGSLIRSMKLTDLIPQMYKDSLPHTVSSLRWRRDSGILPGEETLFIDVLVPTIDPFDDNTDTVRFTINLADGAISLPEEAQWSAAMEVAGQVSLAQIKRELEWLDWRRNPLVRPADCDIGEWNQYLREAHVRKSDEPPFDASASIMIVNSVDHPRHQRSIEYLKEALQEDYGYRNDVAAVAPCAPGVLANAIEAISADIKPETITNTNLYVSTSRDEFARIDQSIAPTGASVIWIDPDVPIPQRADRIPGSDEETAAFEAAMEDLDGGAISSEDLLKALEEAMGTSK